MSKLGPFGANLIARDVEQTMLWFEQTLGFRTVARYPNSPPFIYVRMTRDDAGFLVLCRENYADLLGISDRDAATGTARIPVEGVRDYHAAVSSRVPVKLRLEMQEPGEPRFSIHDPDGNELVFLEVRK